MYSKLYRAILLVLFFIFIYTPNFFQFNVLHIITLFSYILLFLRPEYRKVMISVIKTKAGFIFLSFSFLSILVLSLIILFTSRRFIALYNITTITLQVFPISIIYSVLLVNHKYTKNDIVFLLLNVGLLQAIIATLMFLSPTVKNTILELFFSHYNDFSTMSYWVQYRVFGLAQGMMYAMPITQGFLASVAFLAGLKISVRYFWYIPILLFSAVINARIGIIVFLLNVVLILIINTSKLKKNDLAKIVILVLFLSVFVPGILSAIEAKSEIMSSWIFDGVNEIVDLFRGEKTGYFGALNDMFFLPDLNTIIFGSGKDYFYERYQWYTTDIGYINDLFLGGIFYILLFYVGILFYLYNKRNNKEWQNYFFPPMMVATMLISNIKGYGFRQNEFLNLFVLISTILIIYSNLEKRI